MVNEKWLLGRAAMSCVVFSMVVGVVGCGGRAESRVAGVVTLDGATLDHGHVVFVPASGSGGQGASGQIQSDGGYSIQVGRTGGLPAGDYKVLVVSRAPSVANASGAPPAPGKLLTPEHYGQAQKTDLQFEVKPGRNTINLELSTK